MPQFGNEGDDHPDVSEVPALHTWTAPTLLRLDTEFAQATVNPATDASTCVS